MYIHRSMQQNRILFRFPFLTLVFPASLTPVYRGVYPTLLAFMEVVPALSSHQFGFGFWFFFLPGNICSRPGQL